MILACTCKNEYQDQKYGNGNRYCNPCKKQEKLYRCTVCGKEITKAGAENVSKK